MTKDEARDCDHGRMKGKCDVCDLQAELEATNRQVEILSDALAESRREVEAKDKALDLALEALATEEYKLRQIGQSQVYSGIGFAITAIKQARSAPVQEQMARMEMVVANLVREGVNKHKARELAEHFYSLAQPAPVPDYAWPTVADYEKDVGFEVNEAFKMAWAMARTTNALFTQVEKNNG